MASGHRDSPSTPVNASVTVVVSGASSCDDGWSRVAGDELKPTLFVVTDRPRHGRIALSSVYVPPNASTRADIWHNASVVAVTMATIKLAPRRVSTDAASE